MSFQISMMNKVLILAVATLLFFGNNTSLKAQSIELLGGNTLNGAINGTLLGGATMAVSNSSDFNPLRVGLGLGTLYGIGTGIYDITYASGNDLVVSGLFNDGNNSSIIVVLDTFYGAAAGSVIVTAIMLVANEPLIDGLQYGSGIGAFVGFGFGVFDSFVLANRTTSEFAASSSPNLNANGFVGIDFENGTSLGLVNPSLIQTLDINSSALSSKINPTVELLNLRVNF